MKNVAIGAVWALGVVAAGIAAVSLISSGYAADAQGTTGTLSAFEIAMLGAALVLLATATAMTLARVRGAEITIPRAHVVIAGLGAVASLAFWPLVVVPVVVVAVDVVRAARPAAATA